jgi:CPA1 family monovalent cation:H+ antiporter
MLAFLLFAGAMPLSMDDLRREAGLISILALLGTAASTLIVAGLSWLAFRAIGTPLPWIYAFLFGAIISPTDPIAVLGIMKSVGAPRRLETKLAGESLFNDGVGVVIFLTALDVAANGRTPAIAPLALALLQQIAGGVIVGLICGIVVYLLLKGIDHYPVEVLLTLALAMGGFVLAEVVHVSAPIAAVVAGLVIGNRGRTFGMSEKTREHLDMFWELIDEMLNAVLFLLLGLQMLVIHLPSRYFLAGLAAIAITLLARYVSVAGIIQLGGWRKKVLPGTICILTWCGLRGGLSVAMAISLPRTEYHDTIVASTYAVVIFSVFVQGMTARALVRRVSERAQEPIPPEAAPF